MKQRILLVEDEENLLQTIALNLELEGYDVVKADTGSKALQLFKTAKFDLIVLDVMLPEINGFDVCRKIRQENSTVPILFLTAKNSGQERVEGLKIGADDYLTKPFNLEEFLLRVKILLRRSLSQNDSSTENFNDIFIFGDFEINFKTYEIIGINKAKYTLGKKEIAMLKLLIDKKNEVVSRNEILEKVWGYDVYPTSRTIDNYILNFRKYFEENPKEPKYIHSIRSVGYKFTV